MFHYTVETDQTMEEAIQSLEKSLKEDKFGVLWQFDLKETLNNKGFEFEQPYRVLEVCNPLEAQRILTKNQMVGYFLPCKIVVYEADGKVKIGMPKPTALIELAEDDALMDIARDVENKLIHAIDKSIK
ncbi:DUF302 domain-containing protein [Virgibacillus sp. YIM 98842]|uniref:DUF302 domain-containing protein n=1 Tax=Virgibacillus sp. YIM 98842 TaxID=2663533 RepID=UPI0013D9C612|nr:DUF302 domain-containing protein [Virgibacillus sp. YIM 98842]